MSSNFEDVGKFHEKFGLPVSSPTLPVHSLDVNTAQYRLKFLKEELLEYEEAMERGDLAEAFDALMDLAWVAMGTAHYMGLPWDEGWAEVRRANMDKVHASELPAGVHKAWRGSGDIAKPTEWVAPRIAEVITAHNHGARTEPPGGIIGAGFTIPGEKP